MHHIRTAAVGLALALSVPIAAGTPAAAMVEVRGTPTATPVAAPMFPATVTLTPAVALQYESVVASGRIVPARPGRTVFVQTQRGAGWVTQVRTSTDAQGRFSARVFRAQTGTFSYRVVAPAVKNPAAPAAMSFPVPLRVTGTVVGMGVPSVAVPGVTIRVGVVARPARAGREVAVQVRTGDAWSDVARARTDKTGTAVLALTAPAAASVTYRSTAAPYGKSPGSVGTPRTVTLVPSAPFAAPWTQVAAGTGQCALDSAQRAFCWGSNEAGQLGNGTFRFTDRPIAVDASGVLAGRRLTRIAFGAFTACALDDGGRAYCWGLVGNAGGMLGDGQPPVEFGGGGGASSRPVAVASTGVLAGRRLVDISVGANHVCVLDDQGVAYCWGSNYSGELGNGVAYDVSTGTPPHSPVPVRVATEQRFTDISAGAETTCGVTTAGTVWCWGRNVGTGLADSSAVPVPVDASGVLQGRRIAAVSAGLTACARDTEGRAYCWGPGFNGELGNGDLRPSLSPVAVTMPLGARFDRVAVTAGSVAAIDTAGRLWMWGTVPTPIRRDGRSTVPVAVANGALKGRTLRDVSGWSDLAVLDDQGRVYQVRYGGPPVEAPAPFPVATN